MKKILAAVLSIWVGAAVSAGAGQVYTDAQGNVNLSTVTMQDLCVNDATATRCNTLVGGVNHSGRVGVKTQNPVSELDVNGTITASSVVVEGTITVTGAMTARDLTAATMTVTGTNSGGNCLAVDGTTLVANCSTGSVGVGTASPTQDLHVKQSAADANILVDAPAGNIADVMWAKDGVTKWEAYVPASSNDLRLHDGSDRVTFQSGGNVGIGTASPLAKLHVAGDASVTGASTFGSSVTAAGFGSTSFIQSLSQTKAQLLAITPAAVGRMYYCNDCSPTKMVVSTGTSAGNFAAIDGGAFQ